jgi:large subunit ribosomal protein L21
MYAVIETGGKQYRVEVGTELEVELLDVEPGQSVTLDRVLLVADGDEAAVGRPVVANASVEAEVLRRDRGEKLIVFKYRPKARRRVKKGHRQDHTILRVTDVKLNGKSAAEASRKAEQAAKTERQRLEEAAARQAAADAELAAKLARQADAAKAPKAPKTGGATEASAESGSEAAPAKRTRAKAADADAATAAATDADAAAGTEPEADAAAGAGTASNEQTAEAPKRSRTKKDE